MRIFVFEGDSRDMELDNSALRAMVETACSNPLPLVDGYAHSTSP